MADTLDNVRAAVEAGRQALAHVPPPNVTLVPTMADSGLTPQQQVELVALAGPIPLPTAPFFPGTSMAGTGVYEASLIFFQSEGNVWRETYHIGGLTSALAVWNKMNEIANTRAAFLHTSFEIWKCAVQQVGVAKDSITLPISINGAYPAPTPNTGPAPGPVSVVAHVGFESGARSFRGFRGWDRSQIRFQNVIGNAIQPPDFGLVVAWIQALGGAGFGVLSRTRIQPAPAVGSYNPLNTIDGLSAPGYAIITCDNPINMPGAPAPQTIQISNVDGKLYPGLAGSWTVIQAAGNTVTIRYQVAAPATNTRLAGRLRVILTPSVSKFDYRQVFFHDILTHKTKNAFSPSRRGASARRVRTLG